MSGRLLSADPVTRKREDWHRDPQDNSVVVNAMQDVEPIMEANKEDYNTSDGSFKGELHHVARIPLVVYQDLIRQGILDKQFRVVDRKRFKAWLNDSDNQVWRTHPGRV